MRDAQPWPRLRRVATFLPLGAATAFLIVAAALFLLGRPLDYSIVFLVGGVVCGLAFIFGKRSTASYQAFYRAVLVAFGALFLLVGIYSLESPGDRHPSFQVIVTIVGAICLGVGVTRRLWPRPGPLA